MTDPEPWDDDYPSLRSARLADALLALGAYEDNLALRRNNQAMRHLTVAIAELSKGDNAAAMDALKKAGFELEKSEERLETAWDTFGRLIMRKNENGSVDG